MSSELDNSLMSSSTYKGLFAVLTTLKNKGKELDFSLVSPGKSKLIQTIMHIFDLRNWVNNYRSVEFILTTQL